MLKNIFNQIKNKGLALILFFVFSKSASGAMISTWYGNTRAVPTATSAVGVGINFINWIIGLMAIIFVILLVFSFSVSKMHKKEFSVKKEILRNFKKALLLFMFVIFIIFAIYMIFRPDLI